MSAMIEIVLRSWDDLTGGYVGLAGIPTVWSGQPIAFYALAVVVLAMAVLAYENLMLSRFGRGLTTIRADRARELWLPYESSRGCWCSTRSTSWTTPRAMICGCAIPRRYL